jgi:exopolyphosphatase / guanosine-5'-triphosphate,3'-diphosphate pyrophosphatase
MPARRASAPTPRVLTAVSEPRPAARPAPDGWRRIAAIDIGSNSIRATVADVSTRGEIRIIDELKAAPRLSAGLSSTGALGIETMAAAIEALTRMAALARQMKATRIECVATSAVRDATNGADFVRQVKRSAGIDVRVITGDDEARLSYRSAQAHFDLGHGRVVTCDIGGGSVELALSADGLLERLVSFPFGAVRATEAFLAEGSRPKAVKKLRRTLRDAMRGDFTRKDWRGARMIGAGGTFTNLAAMLLARQGQQIARGVHGTIASRSDVEHVLDLLTDMTTAERVSVPGLTPTRADIIVAGLAVAAEVMAYLDIRELSVSAFGIREGLLLEAADVAPRHTDPGEGRRRSVERFAERTHYEAPHAEHVRHLSLQLFDALQGRLGLSREDRQTLADAALLHDTGYHISYTDHHKHSYHLIMHADLLGVTPGEQAVMANVARYHRGPLPKLKHASFAALTRTQRETVRKLSALLRVADGLDRGHVSAVTQVRTRMTERGLRLTPVRDRRAGPLRLELWGASRKRDLLAEVLGVPILVIDEDGRPVAATTDAVD